MRFTWNEHKNAANKKKHKVSFETARLVFQDPYLISTLDQRFAYDEPRWIHIGAVGKFAVLVVVTTVQEDRHGEEIIHIISARKATQRERRRYRDYP